MTNLDRNPSPRGPLHGYRVVDMTGVIAGPYATQMIADLGAEVIKIESLEGDLMRSAGPHKRHRDMAALYLNINRNKRSLALDLKRESARAAMLKLIASADVFVTNTRPQAMQRLGLDYEAVSKVRENIIYVHLVGFAAGGAYAGRQAFDDLVQAASGLADLEPKKRGEGDPSFVPSVIADKTTALHAVYGLIAALLHRERTGEGQLVEVPMFECTTAFNLVEHLYGHVHSPPSAGFGYTRVLSKNRRPFRTKDGFIAIMPYTEKQWPRFFELCGESARWDRWRGMRREDRNRHIDELYATIGELTQTRTTEEWMELLDHHDIPCMRVNRLDDLPNDPQLRDIGFFEQRVHPSEEAYVTLSHPVRFSRSGPSFRRHAPRLGENGREILAEVGVSDAEFDALLEEGAAALPKDAS